MNLILSQNNTTCPSMVLESVGKSRPRGTWMRRLSRHSKTSRLRLRGPQWMFAALLLLAANLGLAIIAWIIVDSVAG